MRNLVIAATMVALGGLGMANAATYSETVIDNTPTDGGTRDVSVEVALFDPTRGTLTGAQLFFGISASAIYEMNVSCADFGERECGFIGSAYLYESTSRELSTERVGVVDYASYLCTNGDGDCNFTKTLQSSTQLHRVFETEELAGLVGPGVFVFEDFLECLLEVGSYSSGFARDFRIDSIELTIAYSYDPTPMALSSANIVETPVPAAILPILSGLGLLGLLRLSRRRA